MKRKIKICLIQSLGLFLIAILSAGCGDKTAGNDTAAADAADPMKNKGIGPITSVELGALDEAMSAKGKEVFVAKCTACHNTPDIDAKKIGPSLKNVTKRRTPEWIMNQILNPTEMSQKDPIAKELLGIYIAQMANQNLTQDEARNVLEYFRTTDK